MECDKDQVISYFFCNDQERIQNDFVYSEFFNSEVLAQCDMLEKNNSNELIGDNSFSSEDDAALCEIASVTEHQLT